MADVKDWMIVLGVVVLIIVCAVLVAWTVTLKMETGGEASKAWTWREWAVLIAGVAVWSLIDTLGDIRNELRKIQRSAEVICDELRRRTM